MGVRPAVAALQVAPGRGGRLDCTQQRRSVSQSVSQVNLVLATFRHRPRDSGVGAVRAAVGVDSVASTWSLAAVKYLRRASLNRRSPMP